MCVGAAGPRGRSRQFGTDTVPSPSFSVPAPPCRAVLVLLGLMGMGSPFHVDRAHARNVAWRLGKGGDNICAHWLFVHPDFIELMGDVMRNVLNLEDGLMSRTVLSLSQMRQAVEAITKLGGVVRAGDGGTKLVTLGPG